MNVAFFHFRSVYYVTKLDIQHHNIWKFYVQHIYLLSYLTKYIKQFHSNPLLASDDCSKTGRVSICLFLNTAYV